MGPEVIIIALSYNVTAVMTLLHGIGLLLRATRMWSACIIVLAAGAGAIGYSYAPPYWELHSAAYFFALVSLVLTIFALIYVSIRWVSRRLRQRTEPQSHAV
jgi:hypothetical protein